METLEYESCQLNDMDVDRDEGKEELSVVPSAVSDSAGWHEPRCMRDRQFRKEVFMFDDIVDLIVEEDGEPDTMNVCKGCCYLRQAERQEPGVCGKRKMIIFFEKSSRGKLSAWLGTKGFEIKMWEYYAAKDM